MARIPDEVIERLKCEISVQRLAEARGVVLEKHGADLIGRCPFHEDRTPSLVITPIKNLWHCLGACQVGGTVIDWVMRAEGVSFRHAVELLVNDSVSLAASSSTALPPKHSTVRRLPTPLARNVEDAKLLTQVIGYYHDTLKQAPEALDYLKRRGIASEEAIKTFRLGFANRTLGYRLPASNRVEGAALRGQLQRLGLYRASGHEHFSGSLVIPVIAPSGEVTEVYGRKITENLRSGTALHLYLPGAHRGVWNEAALGATKEVILCEALIDALTFWCAGYRNVTASYGVEGFTPDHLAAFQSHGIERVLIAYDRDEAGDRAAEKLARKLMPEGLDCYRILFPKGMDANEYALKVGPAEKSLGVAIRAAQWLGKGVAPGTGAAPGMRPALGMGLKPLAAAAERTLTSVLVPEVNAPSAPSTEAAPASVAMPDPARTPLLPLVAEEAAKEKTPVAEPVLPARVIPESASPVPVPQTQSLGSEREQVITFGQRRYRVRGLEKNLAFEVLKVNVLVSAPDPLREGSEAVHVDTLDLYQARARAAFIAAAARELGVSEEALKGDLGQLLLTLEAEQEKLIAAASAPKVAKAVLIDESARERALQLLQSPDLIGRIRQDFTRAGIVGETTNVLMGYLAALSRKLERPLALLIQSTSAAGKSSLLDAVLRFVPEEDRIVYSAMTGQSLFYMGEMDLKHKLLAIAEEQGAARASYALKLLQSEGELTIASTSKDVATGKLVTEAYRVEGPVMIALTTTAAEIDEELLNRCLVLSIDEGREQTAAIHAQQRERRTLAGLQARCEREAILKLHQDAQRLIEPLAVVNPYAQRLTFLSDRTRTRRDHEKYLTLIDVIALLHQHQRTIRQVEHRDTVVRYVEATIEDIALANELAHEVLGRTLDELPPQTRRLLGLIAGMVDESCRAQHTTRAAYRFSRRQVRETIQWGDTQLKIHLARLVELEYLLVHRGGRGQSFEYELLYDGVTAEGGPHVSGLIDVEVLRGQCAQHSPCATQQCGAQHYDAGRSGLNADQSGAGRGVVGTVSAASRGQEIARSPEETSLSGAVRANGAETAHYRSAGEPVASYAATSP